MGENVEGVIVEGTVTKMDTRGFNVDCGLKFDMRIKAKRTRRNMSGAAESMRKVLAFDNADYGMVKVGDPVKVVVKDLERTAHLQGDSTHSSVYIGLGKQAAMGFDGI